MGNKSMVATGSIQDLASREGASLAETFVHADAIVLIDASGSMEDNDTPDRISRHDMAERELRALQRDFPGKLAVVAFSDIPVFCPGGVPVRLNGGTAMAKALEFVRVADGAGMTFYLISDGYPDSERATLNEARKFTSKINTIFIGPKSDRMGQEFLARLAQEAGGVSATSAEIGELQKPMRLLLEAGG